VDWKIPFNRTYLAGPEMHNVMDVAKEGRIGSDGKYTEACGRFLEDRYGIHRVLMVPSCTSALEIAADLCGIEPGDEVVMPSYTFVSTANAFVRLGAKPVFVDIRSDTMNIDESLLESAITERTKAICPVHYAGVACDMDVIMAVAENRGLMVVEDAAQGLEAKWKGLPLGTIGQLGALSFHDTKNIACGEGGALCINDARLAESAEIVRDKGTNRQRFLRGQTDKYTWIAVGSSHVPSEISAAYLSGQFSAIDEIQALRMSVYGRYRNLLANLADRGLLSLPAVPQDCEQNAHMFYIVLNDREPRDGLMKHLNDNGIGAVFHYIPLHSSPMGERYGYRAEDLPVTEEYSGRLLRLPFFCELTEGQQDEIVKEIEIFFGG